MLDTELCVDCTATSGNCPAVQGHGPSTLAAPLHAAPDNEANEWLAPLPAKEVHGEKSPQPQHSQHLTTLRCAIGGSQSAMVHSDASIAAVSPKPFQQAGRKADYSNTIILPVKRCRQRLSCHRALATFVARRRFQKPFASDACREWSQVRKLQPRNAPRQLSGRHDLN